MSRARPTVKEIYFSPEVKRDQAEQEIYEKNFFDRVQLKSGVFKTTYSRRLDDLNAIIQTRLPADRPLRLMDIAVSSGVTTIEWIQSLQAAAIEHRIVAGDLTVHAFLISFGEQLSVLADRGGYPMHFDILGQGLQTSRLKFPYSIAAKLLRVAFRGLLRLNPKLRSCLQTSGAGYESEYGVKCQPIKLISPRLQRLTDVEIVEDDILASQNGLLDGQFHVLRAANILNRNYFSEEELRLIIYNLRSRLREQGLFTVCRTCPEDGINHATLFRLKRDGSFDLLQRLGAGSEIEDLVLNIS